GRYDVSKSSVEQNPPRPGTVGCDDRQARRERFDHDVAEPLAIRTQHKEVRKRERPDEIGDMSRKPNTPPETQGFYAPVELRSKRALAVDRELRRPVFPCELGEGSDKQVEPLCGHEAARRHKTRTAAD